MASQPLENFFAKTPVSIEEKPKPETVKKEMEPLTFSPETPRNLPKAYLISASYNGEKGVAYLKLYEPKTNRFYFWYDTTGHKPYCLSNLSIEQLQEKDALSTHRGLDHFEAIQKYDTLRDKEAQMTKIVATDPLAIGGRPSGCIRDIVPKAWEADIRYYESFIYDRRLALGMPYQVKDGNLLPIKPDVPSETLNGLRNLFTKESREFQEHIEHWANLFECRVPEFRRVALDIEVATDVPSRIPDPSEAAYPVVCATLLGSDGIKRVLLLRRLNVQEGSATLPSDVGVEYYDDEAKLITEIFKALLDYPVVLSFNGDDFDLRYLYHRAEGRLNFPRDQIPIELGREFALLKYGVHIDLYKFFFNRSLQIYAFSQKYRENTLAAVGEALLGMTKLELRLPLPELSYMELASYCYRDAEITMKLTTYGNDLVMKLLIILSRISQMPIEDVNRQGVSGWIRSLLYYEHRRRDYLIPRPQDLIELKGVTTTEAITKGKKYKGAIVIPPSPGVHFNVPVLDFASLYPSIIKKYNLSYETVLCPHPECRDNKIPETPYWVCRKRRGLYSLIIGSLRDMRVKWYKKRAKDKALPESVQNLYNVVQLTLKVFLNASYGVMGAEAFTLYCPPVAEATAAVGRYAITHTIEKANSLGIKVLYGDTDSIFLEAPTSQQIDELMRWSEAELGMELEIDKVYRYSVFSMRKKNYLGVLPDGSVDIKGLTGKKRHIPKFLKQEFMGIVKTLGEVRSPEDFEEAQRKIRNIVKTCYSKIKNREYSLQDLSFNIMISKPPEKYVKTTPIHVKAARLLVEKGVEVKPGDIISFIKVIGEPGVKPVQLASISEIDVEKYVEYIEATFEQVLDAIGLDFHEILGLTRLEYFMEDK